MTQYVNELATIARGSAGAILDSERWIHRRVESLTFSSELIVRRNVSVDFTVPPGVPTFAIDNGGVAVHFLPLSLLRKWPPLFRFDLRDEDGRPLPLLTKGKNRAVDAEALKAVAANTLSPAPSAALDPLLDDIAMHSGRRAVASLTELQDHLASGYPHAARDRVEGLLRVAGAMVEGSFLWVRVHGGEGHRQTVKYGFDEVAVGKLSFPLRILAGLGWTDIIAYYEIPHLGDAGSYHMHVEPPPPLRVAYTQLFVTEPPSLSWAKVHPSTQSRPRLFRRIGQRAVGTVRVILRAGKTMITEVARAIAAKLKQAVGRSDVDPQDDRREPKAGETYQWNAIERAHLYVSGHRPQHGFAVVAMRVDPRGFFRGALIMTWLIAGLMTIYYAYQSKVRADPQAAVTVLLLVPAVLGYLVVRPGEHPLARIRLTGVRAVVLAAGAVPIAAAVALLAASSKHALSAEWRDLMILAWTLVLVVSLGWLLPAPLKTTDPPERKAPEAE